MQPYRRVAVGLALLTPLSAPARAQEPRNPQEPRNLVANGSFENPPVSSNSARSLTSAGAWSATAGVLDLQNRLGSLVALVGDQHLELDSLSVVRQTCTTRPGQAYSFGFAYRPRTEASEVAFEVRYGGTLLETIVVPGGSSAVWTYKSWLVSGVSTTDAVELRSLRSSSTGVLIDDCFLIPHDLLVTGQLVRNGNFEEDPRIEAGASLSNAVLIGWYSPQLRTVEVRDLGTLGNGASGKNVLDLDESLSVAQRTWVVPDRSYQLKLSWSPNPSDDRDRSFTVSFAGKLIDTIAVTRSSALRWTPKTYTVTSEAPLATLELRDLGGGYNGALIDAVGLTGVLPEPETAGQIALHKIIAHTPTAGIRLTADAMFARGVAALGDVDGDGIGDIAVGSVGDDGGAPNSGAVWVVFLRADRTAKGSQKIGEGVGGFTYDLDENDGFGRAVTGIGDLDGDGVPDMVAGANEDDSGDYNAGAAYVLFLNRNGTVKGQRKISASSGDRLDFTPRWSSEFGSSLAGMGDVDGDGIPDVTIGARFSNSVQVCFLRRDGSVRDSTNITYGESGFTDRSTSSWDLLGMSCANMGDFDGDGIPDLLAGAYGRQYAGQDFVGGQYLMLLNRDGTVRKWHYYGSENINTRAQTLGLIYNFGTACAGLGDVDGDGVRDLAVGAQREGALYGYDIEEGTKQGAVYVFLLNSNGTIKTCQRIGDRAGGLQYRINEGVRFGESLAALGDLDGNGLVDLAIGTRFIFYTGGVFLTELRGKSDFVPRPRADFTASPLSGLPPLAVTFADRSSGPVTGWTWDFGDGTGSDLQGPSHTYEATGVFTVSLTVRGEDGTSDTRTFPNLVTVTGPDQLPPGVTKLGCGVNPPSSFRLISGSPRLGTTMTFGIDNPFGTQAVGSIPMLVASWNSEPNRPCGSLVAGQGMSAPGTSGERLLLTPNLATRTGAPWRGPGTPAPVNFTIPSSASLVGRNLHVQGRLLDRSAGAAIPIGLADGFQLTLQP